MRRSVKLSTAKLVVVPSPTRLVSPHRLEAQDTALSRRRHGFESRWGHLLAGRGGAEAEKQLRAISSGVERLPYKEEVAGSNPASPTFKLPGNDSILRAPREGQGALPGPVAATVLQPE